MSDRAGFIPEVETALLGALLGGGDHGAVLAQMNDFYFVEPIHQAVFAAIRDAHLQFNNTTMPVVMKVIAPSILADFKEATGGELSHYLASCVANSIYTSGTAKGAAGNVRQQWARLTFAEEMANARESALLPGADPLAIMRVATGDIESIASQLRRSTKGKSRSIITVPAAI